MNLQAILASPSAASWTALGAWVEAQSELDVPALEAALDAWPDALRSLRWPDDEDLVNTAFGKLAVVFEVNECDAVTAVKRLAKLAGKRVRGLSFRECERLEDAVHHLDAMPRLAALDVDASDAPELLDALATLSLPNLRTLRLQSAFVPIALVDADFWPTLTSLSLVIEAADAIAVQALFPDESAPTLTHLELVVGRTFDGSPLDVARALADLPCAAVLRTS